MRSLGLRPRRHEQMFQQGSGRHILTFLTLIFNGGSHEAKTSLGGFGSDCRALALLFLRSPFHWPDDPKEKALSFGDKIAIVEIKGIITQSTEIIEEIRQYQDDEAVKAIILRIDSPGGGVGPSQEIHREILKLKTKKKVLTSMGSVAASGGTTLRVPPISLSPTRGRSPVRLAW